MTAGNVPYIFTAVTTAVSAQVNANFAALVTDLNGIDALQITSGTLAIARFPIVTLAKGGSGADLSATGPGLLQQATNASVVSIAANGQLPATATNDSAAAGKLGEYITSNTISSPVGLTSTFAAALTSVALTAGDWDVRGVVIFNSSAGMTSVQADCNSISGTLGTLGTLFVNAAGFASQATVPIVTQRFSLSGSASIYLNALSIFPGTCLCSGLIAARRMR